MSPASNFVGELSSRSHCSKRSYRGGLRILSGDSSLSLARLASSRQFGQVQRSASSSLMWTEVRKGLRSRSSIGIEVPRSWSYGEGFCIIGVNRPGIRTLETNLVLIIYLSRLLASLTIWFWYSRYFVVNVLRSTRLIRMGLIPLLRVIWFYIWDRIPWCAFVCHGI